MSGLKLQLLGAPHFEKDGKTIEIGRRKAVALLAYLAVTAQTHRRESLAAMFWLDYDESRAFAYLRRTLWSLISAPHAMVAQTGYWR
jgi:DNA-binding SARP family transcriptional activator